MHFIMLVVALSVAWGWRCLQVKPTHNWQQRWQQTLKLFLFPPLFLLTTAIAICWMELQSDLTQKWFDGLSFLVAIGLLGFAGILGLKLLIEAGQSKAQINTYQQLQFNGQVGRLLNSSIPYAAQVGLWQPELVVSQGLLDLLPSAHLEAVLAHEQAHLVYRDTFWFLLLGWLRRLTAWLPQTEALWQDLLLLREIRADAWAAQRVNALLLIESLLLLANPPTAMLEPTSVTFSSPVVPNRLIQRVDALLTESIFIQPLNLRSWIWLLLVLLPLTTIPLHSLSHEFYCLLSM
ncbi:MAG TPA: M56 family metallopeptidase [Allocoleopsis sp.]